MKRRNKNLESEMLVNTKPSSLVRTWSYQSIPSSEGNGLKLIAWREGDFSKS